MLAGVVRARRRGESSAGVTVRDLASPGHFVSTGSEARNPSAANAAGAASAIDPICGMSVAIATAEYRSEYQGVAYFFCCAGCQNRFEKEPAHYLGRARATAWNSVTSLPANVSRRCRADESSAIGTGRVYAMASDIFDAIQQLRQRQAFRRGDRNLLGVCQDGVDSSRRRARARSRWLGRRWMRGVRCLPRGARMHAERADRDAGGRHGRRSARGRHALWRSHAGLREPVLPRPTLG